MPTDRDDVPPHGLVDIRHPRLALVAEPDGPAGPAPHREEPAPLAEGEVFVEVLPRPPRLVNVAAPATLRRREPRAGSTLVEPLACAAEYELRVGVLPHAPSFPRGGQLMSHRKRDRRADARRTLGCPVGHLVAPKGRILALRERHLGLSVPGCRVRRSGTSRDAPR